MRQVRLKILLIDDDELVADTLRLFLGTQNDVLTAKTLKEAKQALCSQIFDLVLLDKALPDGDGLTLIREIKNMDRYQAIIVLTGDSDFNSASKALEMGADDYIMKSNKMIADLQVRIPIVLTHIMDKKELAKKATSPSTSLPQTYRHLNPKDFKKYFKENERQYFEKAVALCNGHVDSVAIKLGITRATVFKKMREMKIKAGRQFGKDEKPEVIQ